MAKDTRVTWLEGMHNEVIIFSACIAFILACFIVIKNVFNISNKEISSFAEEAVRHLLSYSFAALCGGGGLQLAKQRLEKKDR